MLRDEEYNTKRDVPIDLIVSVEGGHNKITVSVAHEHSVLHYHAHMTLKAFMLRLHRRFFMRVHKSYLINLHYAGGILKGRRVAMKPEGVLPVSKDIIQELRMLLRKVF